MTDTTTLKLYLTDRQGDSLTVRPHATQDRIVVQSWAGDEALSAEVWPDRQQVAELVDYLIDWLEADDAEPMANWERELMAMGGPECPADPTDPTDPTGVNPANELPDAEADGYGWGIEAETILEEAGRAVYGDRQDAYGHPREDFTRTAIIWTGLLHHKLADGVHLEAEDIARCQIGVKLARDVHAPKRDNRVDMAGYALTLDRLETGR